MKKLEIGKATYSWQQRRAHLGAHMHGGSAIKVEKSVNPLANYQNLQIFKNEEERKVVMDHYHGKMFPKNKELELINES